MKSFLYIDEYKLKSIASQVFEGLTEYILDKRSISTKSSEDESKILGSNKVMAEIFGSHASLEEKKYLLDHGYELLERELYSKSKVLDLSNSTIESNINSIEEYNFINVKGKIIINDTKLLANLLANFNRLGEALGYLTYKNELDQADELQKEISKVKDRNKRTKLKKHWNKTSKTQILQELGLNLEKEYLDNLKHVVDFGYSQQLELQMPMYFDESYKLFSSILNRDFLREPEEIIIQKYSRETEKEFNIFGMISQSSRDRNDIKPSTELKEKIEDNIQRNGEELGMKQAIMNITNAISNIEFTFSGKLDYEIVIDPIAVYWNLEK